MKYEDLTKEQKDAFHKILKIYNGKVPVHATHFDMGDISASGFIAYVGNGDWKVAWSTGGYSAYVPDVDDLDNMIPIPEKPWYIPEDVAFNSDSKMPSGSSNSYYWIEIPIDRVKIDEASGTVGFMLEEYLKFGLNNDFDRCNLAKANHRIGKKGGNSKEYEVEKMHYYVDQINKNMEVV
jgi:hypothetical protein